MSHTMPTRDAGTRSALRHSLETLGYEVIPLKRAEAAVVESVPKSTPLTVTASPTKGQDATVDLATRLAGLGYDTAPHFSAQLVRDRRHLTELVARCRDVGIRAAFVIGGDRTGNATEFEDATALLRALHELDHSFTDIGIGGHPEGHPVVPDNVLFTALKDKASLATSITTQIVFDPATILTWARDLRDRGIDLPIHVGVPGAVHKTKLLRVSTNLGIGESLRFVRKQQSLLYRFLLPGGYRPDSILHGLGAHLNGSDQAIAGFHVFTFNDLGPTEAWRQRTLRQLATAPGVRRARR